MKKLNVCLDEPEDDDEVVPPRTGGGTNP